MSKAPQAFRIITTADREGSESKEWIVDNLLGAGEVSGLIGPPTAGKSALALDLAAKISAGDEWFGRGVVRGSGLYFAAERWRVTRRRLNAFETYHELGRLNVGIVPDRLDLLNGIDDAERVLSTVKSQEDATGAAVRLIVIDTVRAAMPGGDENSARDMGRLAQHVGHVRDGAPNAHVMLIHHTPKGRPAELSGHTALAAMLDIVMVVAVAKGDRRSWCVGEANDLPALPAKEFFALRSVAIGRDGSGGQMTAPVVEPIAATAASTGPKPQNLPNDARTALKVLASLSTAGEPIDLNQWRAATLDAFGDRAKGAKRQAWKSSMERLVGTGNVIVNGESVSVSLASG